MRDTRLEALKGWLKTLIDSHFEIEPIVGDASFRRYFRVYVENKHYIGVDAPPEKEDSYPFVAVGKAFCDLTIRVPQIFAHDLEQGFLLLSDLGDALYYRTLQKENADHHYQRALDELVKIQSCQSISDWQLPSFDRSFILQELENFRIWYLETHLKISLSSTEHQLLTATFEKLIDTAINQPQCCIHRDYHSKNLMILPNTVGILDFQDAAWGPITYDAVSLLRDCYITWPAEKVNQWALYFYHQIKNNIEPSINQNDFMRWFDWMGIQRHLKAIFIFARKYHRDQVDHYLQYIPNGLRYVMTISVRYPELQAFHYWMKNTVLCDEVLYEM